MSMDPIAMLSISVHSQPGVYALLLGSGLSSSAGILTGHGVTLDLIRQIAAARGETSEPSPEAWLQATLGVAPDYSSLLTQLAPEAAERAGILQPYFKASSEDQAAGRKVPTAAHRVIARLTGRGLVRVILTTNFDPLIEDSLRAEGIHPYIISSAETARGAPPPQNSACTLIKVNGNYLDPSMRNTEEELSSYSPEIDAWLDRIFDEYGLIVCGWSSRWDLGLRQAIQRATNRRYSAYWVVHNSPNEYDQALIDFRRAVVIGPSTADEFFGQLEAAVTNLDARPTTGGAGQPPVSTEASVRQLKRALADDSGRIEVHDLMDGTAAALNEQAENLYSSSGGANGPRPTIDEITSRVSAYDDMSTAAMAVAATAAFFARPEQYALVTGMVSTATPPRLAEGGYTVWIELQRYPGTLVLYAAGIGAVAAGRYDLLRDLFELPVGLDVNLGDAAPATLFLSPGRVLEHQTAQGLTFLPRPNLLFPMSEHLAEVLRAPSSFVIRSQAEFETAFDRFEYLSALVQADLSSGKRWSSFYIGRFAYQGRAFGGTSRQSQLVEQELAAQGADWPLLRAGSFGSDLDRVSAAKEKVDYRSQQIAW